MKRLLFGLLMLGASAAMAAGPSLATRLAAAGFDGATVQRFRLVDDLQRYTHQVPLSLVVLAGSKWTLDKVLAVAHAAVPVFAQCGLALGPVTYIEAPLVAGQDTLTANAWEARHANQLRAAAVPYPTILFTLEDKKERWAYAYPTDICRQTSRCHTGWMTHDIWMEGYKSEYAAGAHILTFAHELGHIFLQSREHVTGPANLMHDESRLVRSTLTGEQCAAMRAHPLVQRLR